ncbi:unnamed protein product [Prunus armeniaca]
MIGTRVPLTGRTSIEDSAVRAGGPSPPVGQLIPIGMVVEDSSVWFNQTIPSWIVPPPQHLDTWMRKLGYLYLDMSEPGHL